MSDSSSGSPAEVPLCVKRQSLKCRTDRTQNRPVNLYLAQDWHGDVKGTSPNEAAPGFDRLLSRIPQSADLVVLSEHPAARKNLGKLEFCAKQNDQVIVTLLGPDCRNGTYHNELVVLSPNDDGPLIVDKLAFSADELGLSRDLGHLVHRGSVLWILDTTFGIVAVLNCHDYTHADVLRALVEERVEILVVLTRNRAMRLYREYALADTHRHSAFVVVSNIAEFGGSTVAAPFRRGGPDNELRLGGRLFDLRGPARAEVEVELALPELRACRTRFQELGVEGAHSKAAGLEPIVSTEMFHPGGRPWLGSLKEVRQHEIAPMEELADEVGVALCQLSDIGLEAYLNTSYRISRAGEDYRKFLGATKARVEGFVDHAIAHDKKVHFLVFPEVFVPRSELAWLEEISRRLNAVIVAGLDYPDDPADSRNDCVVIIPPEVGEVACSQFTYTKLTRSQYDAREAPEPGQKLGPAFDLKRGTELLRFRHGRLGTFGVLICYDISHHEIVHALNLHGSAEPVELLIVVCYNPYADLYRSVCMTDAHRYYQYVAICNVAKFGGSGIFGPVRIAGSSQVVLEAGNAETIALGQVKMADLRAARRRPEPCTTRRSDFQLRPGVYGGRRPH